MSVNKLASSAQGLQSSAIRELLKHSKMAGVISLGGGIPNPDLFDHEDPFHIFILVCLVDGHADEIRHHIFRRLLFAVEKIAEDRAPDRTGPSPDPP